MLLTAYQLSLRCAQRVHELRKVQLLAVCVVLRAVQHGHEVAHGAHSVLALTRMAAQRIVQMLFDQSPLMPSIHTEHLAAGRGEQ